MRDLKTKHILATRTSLKDQSSRRRIQLRRKSRSKSRRKSRSKPRRKSGRKSGRKSSRKSRSKSRRKSMSLQRRYRSRRRESNRSRRIDNLRSRSKMEGAETIPRSFGTTEQRQRIADKERVEDREIEGIDNIALPENVYKEGDMTEMEDFPKLAKAKGVTLYEGAHVDELGEDDLGIALGASLQERILWPPISDIRDGASPPHEDLGMRDKAVMLYLRCKFPHFCIMGEGDTRFIITIDTKEPKTPRRHLTRKERKLPTLRKQREQKKKRKGSKSPPNDTHIEDKHPVDFNVDLTPRFEVTVHVGPSFWKDFHDCLGRGVRLIAFDLRLIRRKEREFVGAHANFCIYDTETKTLERFDPHGSTSINEYTDQYLGPAIVREFQENLKLDPEYLPPEKFCATLSSIFGTEDLRIKGPQSIEFEGEMREGEKGFCVAWCTLYAELRLAHPDVDRSQFFTEFMQNLNENAPIIRGYNNMLNEYTDIIKKMTERGASESELQDEICKMQARSGNHGFEVF